jgi:predicted pyridoxine 5'-phosphate oxidase superfamily flavin-nucleotide-binding protein
MWQRAFYHEGMSELQDRFDGRRVAEAIERHRKHYEFWDDEKALIESSPFFFIGTSFADYVDCSIKSGDPGFVKVVGPNIIEYPEYDGNSMYRTLGNLSKNPNVGLLFVRFDGKSRRMRINGRAEILDDAAAIGRHYGAQLVVRIECEIYPNCPRYVPDLAGASPSPGNTSPYVPREGEGPPPPPEWKGRDYIRDILPAGDPHAEVVKTGPRER